MNTPSPVSLSRFRAWNLDRGAGRLKEVLWLIVRSMAFLHMPFPFYGFRRCLLRWFGAQVGKGVVIKPGVKITFPWKLVIADNAWLGEDCWILNLDRIEIGANVCLSQRAMLCTGSHDWTSPRFELILRPVTIESGAWIAAGAFVGPGVTVGTHAVLTANSVATRDLEPYAIYQGNPAEKVRDRILRSPRVEPSDIACGRCMST